MNKADTQNFVRLFAAVKSLTEAVAAVATKTDTIQDVCHDLGKANNMLGDIIVDAFNRTPPEIQRKIMRKTNRKTKKTATSGRD